MQDRMIADKELQLWVLLLRTEEVIWKVRQRELNAHDISLIGAGALIVIRALEGQATPAKIARWLFREPHSVAGLLNRMEKQGLVRRTKDLDRKNLIRVTLTDKGEQVCDLVSERGTLHRILSGLPEEQRRQLESILHILLDQALKELAMEVNLPSGLPR